MIHRIHTPTEQFGFVETEWESDTPTDIAARHAEVVEAAKPKTGIDSTDFNQVLDEYLTTGAIPGDPGIIERMSVEQVAILQAIKRSKKRTNK